MNIQWGLFCTVNAVCGPHRQSRKGGRLHPGCQSPPYSWNLECLAQAHWSSLRTPNSRWFVCLGCVKQIYMQRDASWSTLEHRCYQTLAVVSPNSVQSVSLLFIARHAKLLCYRNQSSDLSWTFCQRLMSWRESCLLTNSIRITCNSCFLILSTVQMFEILRYKWDGHWSYVSSPLEFE